VLGTLFILVFDEGFQGGEKTIESVIRDQDKQIEQLTTTIAILTNQLGDIAKNKKTADEIASITRQVESKVTLCSEAQQQIDGLKDGIAKNQAEWDAYTIAYRKAERAAEIGKQYPEITTQSGRVYKDVTIKKIDDLRVGISHQGGSGNINWNDLPKELIDRLLFTKELADIQTKAEQGAVATFSASAEIADIQTNMAYLKEKMTDATTAFESQSAMVSQESGENHRLRESNPPSSKHDQRRGGQRRLAPDAALSQPDSGTRENHRRRTQAHFRLRGLSPKTRAKHARASAAVGPVESEIAKSAQVAHEVPYQ
jgi:hypothetical protein